MTDPFKFNVEPLSPAGEVRKEQILRMAKAAAVRKRAARRAAIAAGTALVLGLATAPLWWPSQAERGRSVARHAASSTTSVKPPTVPRRESAEKPPRIEIVMIATDPNITQRLAVKTAVPNWRLLSDDELLRRLSSNGEPAGLAYVDGRTILITPRHPTP